MPSLENWGNELMYVFILRLSPLRDVCLFSPQNEVSSEELDGGLKKVTFARTPIMSVYLLAFIVGEYDFVEATDANGVKIRVYTPVGKAEDGRFALDVSPYNLLLYFMGVHVYMHVLFIHIGEFSRKD